jgi:DNA repair exonuclease SbcCD ATPase subunit
MIDIASKDNHPAFRLLRVISIDSYSPSGEVILRVNGGAILTGENGAGKTSLIRLIPVFFGELPRRISVGTQSFGDFYLARTTSYIIFEYERRGVICLAAMYAGTGDESYTYRFIRAPYDLGLFTDQDCKTIIPGDGLPTHLKKLGVDHSRGLAHDGYRAVIQGRAHAGRDAATHRGYVADYAFTPQSNRLDHIDRIVSGMFRRQAEFRDFLRMVVSYISDKDDPIAISGDRGKIAVWPKQYSSYQTVMQHAPRMAELERLDADLGANSRQFGLLHAKLQVLARHYKTQVEELNAACGEAQEKLTKDTATHAEEDERLGKQETDARLEAEGYEARVKGLDTKKEEYAALDVETKARLVDSLDVLKEQEKVAQQRKEALLGAKEKIDQKYEGLKQAATSGLNARMSVALEKKDAVATHYQQELDVLAGHLEEELTTLGSYHNQIIEAATEEAGAVRETVGRLEHAAANPTPDAAAVEAWQRKSDDLDKARKALLGPQAALEKSIHEQKQAQDAYDRQDALVQSLGRQIDDLGSDIQRLSEHANPSPGSLLAFLRKERPDWHLDIAKVVNEDILGRSDLDPELVKSGIAALYGVSVDLSRIDSPLVADEGRLRDEIATIEAQRGRLREQLNGEGIALKAAYDALARANVALGDARKTSAEAAAAVGTAETEERTARVAMDQSRRNNQAQAKIDLDSARVRERAAQAKVKEARRTHAEAEKKLKDRYATLRQEKEMAKGREQRMLDDAVAADKAVVAQQIEALEQERSQALAKEGVDVVALKGIEGEIQGLNQQIRDANQSAKKVSEWRVWLAESWAGRASLVQNASENRERQARFAKKRKDKTQAWQEHRNAAQERIGRMERDARVAAETSTNASLLIVRRDLAKFPPDAEILEGLYDMAWTLDGLTALVNKLGSERRVAQDDLKTRVNEIKRAFRSGSGTPTEDYYRLTADEVDPDDNNPQAWVVPLRVWYGGRHEDYLRPLLVEARKFGELIISFHRDIEKFSKRIRTFNTSMQAALDQTIVFNRISQVKIHFASTITEKAYWVPINDFIRNHEAWIHGISHDLPPPAFATDLDRLLEHWDIREGIRAERLSLIDVSGEVVENGVEKRFRDSATLADLSSNGLSYLILIIIFVAFLRMIRGNADICVTYAVDELGDLDRRNIGILVDMLRQNGIDLVSACPDADLDVLLQFPNRYRVTRDGSVPELVEVDLEMWEPANV